MGEYFDHKSKSQIFKKDHEKWIWKELETSKNTLSFHSYFALY
jgi:hypothetical protein